MNAFFPVDGCEVILDDIHLFLRNVIVWRVTKTKAGFSVLLQVPVGILEASETAALRTTQKQIDRTVPTRLIVMKVYLRKGFGLHLLQGH